MLQGLENIRPAGDRRRILVVDDEAINRELLGLVLSEDYEILYACDGAEALAAMREHRGALSLVLLDLMMPAMSGLELLRVKREEPEIQQIPVIVLTAGQDAEVESLNLGAIDFIPKPYPQADVIMARVRRVIELFEDRETIQSTERDPLTGLYTREYFYRYCEQFDQHHPGQETDAVIFDISHFHMINERFGAAYGDELLRRIGARIRELVQEQGGLACRRVADTFMLYRPHRDNYRELLEDVVSSLSDTDNADGRVRLRMGVYENADRRLDLPRRFDRAKSAADSVRDSFNRAIGYYDNSLLEQEIYHEQLIEDFPAALRERQFEVWYQPKFDIRTRTPALTSAEALVRWRHPRLGLVSPGVFIPLFEANGLIEALDTYVWQDAARQLRAWKDQLGFCVPVSVNVSRIDMLNPALLDTLSAILEANRLEPAEFLLEITESAYTQGAEQIIGCVERLRALGFRVEMDDFGTGYSSLSMISQLPIDALKLDMQFFRNAFSHRQDTRMLEVIIEIADYLSVPVIAEGVETLEQFNALRVMGCDIVQGYYFSRPLPAAEFERFLLERRDMDGQELLPAVDPRERNGLASNLGRVAYALSSGYESIYYVDTVTNHYMEFSSQGQYRDLKIEKSGTDFFADTLRNIPRVVFEGDQERLCRAMEKETLLAGVDGSESFSILYQLVINGRNYYYNLKAVRAGAYDHDHLVLGVRNVDREIRNARRIGEQSSFSPDFTGLAKALSRDIESVYYINVETDDYIEYVSDGAYGLLELNNSGANFFDECQRNVQKSVYAEDWEKVATALDKQTLLAAIESRKSFSMDYRLVIGGQPLYYRMKVIPAETGAFRHIIIGVSNVDAQINEEQRLMAERQNLQSLARISQALSQDYFIIYYVDVETDYFIEYSARGSFSEFGLEKRGEDFFNLSRRNIPIFTYEGDQEELLRVFTKENVLRELDENGSLTVTYRMMLGGKPRYVRMKASRLDKRHIVIGTSDVDAEVQRQKAATVKAGIAQALSSDYFVIFYVDTQTNRYVEYRAAEDDRELDIEQGGEDFFRDSRERYLPAACAECREQVSDLLEKDKLLELLNETGSYTLDFRMFLRGSDTYVHLKASRMADRSDPHIVVGLRNIDARVRREKAQAMALQRATELASRDALTGVKSKRVFVEAELMWDERIAAEADIAFAVAVFDLNGLKHVNDTLGHAAGDDYIRMASAAICGVFQHSPVYRIGGDEFAVIMTGGDYEQRAQLIERFRSSNVERADAGAVVVACGAADYLPGTDTRFQDVFERADADMYESKRSLKERA